MKCLRCAAEIPPQSKFCLRCGTPVNATMETPAYTRPPSTPLPAMRGAGNGAGNKGMWVALGAIAVLAMALGAFVVRGQLTQKAGENQTGNLVQAPGENRTGNLVQKPGEVPKTPIVQAAGENNAVVIDYLERLKEIEATKRRIQKDVMVAVLAIKDTLPLESAKAALQEYGSPDGTAPPAAQEVSKSGNKVAVAAAQFSSDYDQLTAKFNELRPPAPCLDLHRAYYDYMGRKQQETLKTIDWFIKMMKAIEAGTASEYLQEARGKLGKSFDSVDKYEKNCDSMLQKVFDGYKIPSSSRFEIGGDAEGSAGLSGLLGM
ncbi:MAG: zinc ribbon domain-containing protein [Chthonomonadaceae bacterium]|nr:zinc ribbon domain-containing protein [Chthonomonadaceae bacterium]